MRPLTFIALHSILFWPFLKWYASRLPDCPQVLLPLAVLLWILTSQRKLNEKWHGPMLPLACLLIGYALCQRYFPPIVAALLIPIIIAILIRGAFQESPPIILLIALLYLSLPIMPSLNFFAGYPLRLLVSKASALLLQINGLQVFSDGTTLIWQQQAYAVDAPCSGLKMLWVGFALSAIIAIWQKSNVKTSIMLFSGSLVILISCNVMRTTSLFYNDFFLKKAFSHDSIGLVLFCLACVSILAWNEVLRRKIC